METERPTTELTCPSGKIAKLVTYLTARERRVVRNSYIEAVNPAAGISPSSEKLQEIKTQISTQKLSLGEDALIATAVREYDGSAETIVDRLLDGPDAADHTFLLEKANALVGDFQAAK